MINRALLRIKVAQVLYACFAKENTDLTSAENELQLSIQKSYDLYHYLLLLIAESRRYTEVKADALRDRIGGVRVNEMFNEQFINNKFARQLGENTELYSYANDRGLSWAEDTDFIKYLISQINRREYYCLYTAKKNPSYGEDKKFWRDIIANEFQENEQFDQLIEQKSIYWSDDLDIILSFVEKTIKQFKEENGADQPLLPMFKDEADKTFAVKLLDSVILNNKELENTITKYLIDWDIDRIATMDLVILKTAIAELLYFSTIPVNVTFDEYIELAKYYGTKKSSKFINGVLDKIVKDLRQTSELSKFKLPAKTKKETSNNADSDK
jgi:N utilization substance protein B